MVSGHALQQSMLVTVAGKLIYFLAGIRDEKGDRKKEIYHQRNLLCILAISAYNYCTMYLVMVYPLNS